jgi:hypothetical protein
MRQRTWWAAAGLGVALAACQDPSSPSSGGEAPPPLGADVVQKKGRGVTLALRQAEWLHPNQHVDLVGLLVSDGEPMSMTLVQNVVVLGAAPLRADARDGTRLVTLLLLPEETEVSLLAAGSGALFASVRNPEDIDVQEERGRATPGSLFATERRDLLLKKRTSTWK